MSEFGDLVRKLREEEGLSLKEASKRIGVSKSYLSGIERGKVNAPSAEVAHKIAMAFRYRELDLILTAYGDRAPTMVRDELRTQIRARLKERAEER